MQPAYYENLEEIQKKLWSMLDDAVINRSSPFRIPVFICADQNDIDGRIVVLRKSDKNKNIFYLLVHLSGKVYKINSKNGKIEKNFGNKGYVDAFTLVAPLIYQNKLIVVGTNNLSVFELDSGND